MDSVLASVCALRVIERSDGNALLNLMTVQTWTGREIFVEANNVHGYGILKSWIISYKAYISLRSKCSWHSDNIKYNTHSF
jgi:hypothetical protein